MAEKVAKLGITRDKNYMYYVKAGNVWRVRRKMPNMPKGKPEKVANAGVDMDTDYIYFVDRAGDVSRAKRVVGGQKRKISKNKPVKKGKATVKSSRKSSAKPKAKKSTKKRR